MKNTTNLNFVILILALAYPAAAGENLTNASAVVDPPREPATDNATEADTAFEVRAADIKVVGNGFDGHFEFTLGDRAAKNVSVAAPRGGTLAATASFLAAPDVGGIRVRLIDSNDVVVLSFQGEMTDQQTMRVADPMVDRTRVDLDPTGTSFIFSSGTVDGVIEARVLYAQWSGERHVQFGVAPATANGKDTAASDVAAMKMIDFYGEGPELVAAHEIENGPLAVRFVVRVLGPNDEILVTSHGDVDWLVSNSFVMRTEPRDAAYGSVLSVTVQPMRTSNLTGVAIPNALLLGEVGWSPIMKSPDPGSGTYSFCEKPPCDDPAAPLGVRLVRALKAALSWVGHNAAMVMLFASGAVFSGALLVARAARRPRAAAPPKALSATAHAPRAPDPGPKGIDWSEGR